jgi:hypothetical protein
MITSVYALLDASPGRHGHVTRFYGYDVSNFHLTGISIDNVVLISAGPAISQPQSSKPAGKRGVPRAFFEYYGLPKLIIIFNNPERSQTDKAPTV